MTRISSVLLINRGSRRSRAAYNDVMAACSRHGLDFDKVYTVRTSADIKSAVSSIKRQQPKLVVLAGGDGTVSYATGLLAGVPVEIGVIPLGTTNNFARSLDLTPDIDQAVDIIVKHRASPVSLGKINQRYFTNVTGIGISALVAGRVTYSQKRRWGRLAYALVGARELIRHRAFHVTLTDKDRELQMHFRTHQLIIANGRFHAGKEIAADASLDKRELIVFAIGGRSRLSFLWYMIDFYLGQRKSIRNSSYLIARDIRIVTDRPQSLELDGEVASSKTPLRVQVAPRSVNVRYPRVSK